MRSAFEWILILVSVGGFAALGWYTAHGSQTNAASLEAQLERGAEMATLELGAGWAEVKMDGQTVVLTGEAPTEEALAELEAALLSSSPVDVPGVPEDWARKGGPWIGGVVRVDNQASVAEAIRPYQIVAEKTPYGGVSLFGTVPDNAAIETLILAAESHFPDQVTVELAIGAGVPGPEWVRTFEELLPLVAQEGVQGAFLTDTDVRLLVSAANEAEDSGNEDITEELGRVDVVLPGLPDGYTGSITYVSEDASSDEGEIEPGDAAPEEG